MSNISSVIVMISILGIAISVIWLIVSFVRKKNKKIPIISLASCFAIMVVFTLIGTASWMKTDDYQEYLLESEMLESEQMEKEIEEQRLAEEKERIEADNIIKDFDKLEIWSGNYIYGTCENKFLELNFEFDGKDIAREFACMIFFLNELDKYEIDNYYIKINSGKESAELDKEKVISNDFDNSIFPKSYIDFMEKNVIGNGVVTIFSFVKEEDVIKDVNKIAEYLIDNLGILLKEESELRETDAEEGTEIKENTGERETEKSDVLREKDYSLGENDKLKIAIIEESGKESLFISADIADEQKASFGFIYMYSIFEQEAMKNYDYSITVKSNSGMISYINNTILGTNKDGSASLSMPDWMIQDASEITLNDDEQSKIIKDLANSFGDFTGKGIIAKSNILVFEDEKVRIYYSGVTEKGVSFSVQNMTDANITIQCDTISLNGKSYNSILMSDNVAPQSTGDVVAKFEVDTTLQVETIGGAAYNNRF